MTLHPLTSKGGAFVLKLGLVFNKKTAFVYLTKEVFLTDALLAERDAHCVRDADFVYDSHLRRVNRTHRITYHLFATTSICDIISRKEVVL